MHPTPELVTLLLLERDREVERARLARTAACVCTSCSPSFARRLARAMRLEPGSC